MIEGQAKEAGLKTVNESFAGSDLWLIGSPLHFKQVLLNLYNNAMKYNKPGGLLYTKIAEYSKTDKMIIVELTVKDTGIGMTKQFIDKELFAPFAQGENGTRTKFKGSGLGMSIVKEIIQEMNGIISVESKVGEGSTFTVLLPFEIDYSDHSEVVKEEEVLQVRKSS